MRFLLPLARLALGSLLTAAQAPTALLRESLLPGGELTYVVLVQVG